MSQNSSHLASAGVTTPSERTGSVPRDPYQPITEFMNLVFGQTDGDFDRAVRAKRKLEQLSYTIDYRSPGLPRLPRKSPGKRKAVGQ